MTPVPSDSCTSEAENRVKPAALKAGSCTWKDKALSCFLRVLVIGLGDFIWCPYFSWCSSLLSTGLGPKKTAITEVRCVKLGLTILWWKMRTQNSGKGLLLAFFEQNCISKILMSLLQNRYSYLGEIKLVAGLWGPFIGIPTATEGMCRDCAHHVAGFGCVIHDASALVTEGTSSTPAPGGGNWRMHVLSISRPLWWVLPTCGSKSGGCDLWSPKTGEHLQGLIFSCRYSRSQVLSHSSQLAAGNLVGSSVPESCSLKSTCIV